MTDQPVRCLWARTPLGMANDHTIDCFRYELVGTAANRE
jgi:hypothetical protein